MAANEAAGEQKPEASLFPPSLPELPGQLLARTGYVEDFLRVENEVGGHFQQPLFGDRDELPYPRPETTRVSTLNVDESGPSEPADKPFA